MIYFYLIDGTVNRYNLNFELNTIENYGILIENLISNINNYIYGIQNIILNIREDEEDIRELNLEKDVSFREEITNHEKIVKILIYERERNEEGNVKPSLFVDKYLDYQVLRQDQLYAESLQNERPRRPFYSFTSILE